MSPGAELPNIAEILVGVLQRVPRAQQPLLIAVAERMAAQRYRGWASEVTDPAHQVELLACADREEQIATRIEALYPDAASVQRDLLATVPDLEALNRSLFSGRPLEDQFALQAQGERLGAATWRAFAQHQQHAGETFLACAVLEEESAAVLEALCGRQP